MLDLGTLKIGVKVDDKGATTGLQGVQNQIDKTATKTSKFSSGIKKMGKVAGVAAAATATAFIAIGKQALESYATFEQLEGGVEKLFGDDAQQVMKKASDAFATTGFSANQYMDTVTSSAAAMIKSLGGDTEKAAEQSDKMITQMADNASIFGTSMTTLQQAYGNFARQNFTMLDNLKLGYAGSKEGMEQLLEDAEKISGVDYDISNLSDIVDAIQIIQEEEHIAGNAAAEASKTIEGSVNMAKAAWENLLTGLADDEADIAELTNNFSESLVTASENIIPRIKQILEALPQAMTTIVGGLMPQLLSMITSTLPQLTSGVVSMLTTLISQLTSMLPSLFQQVVNLIPQLVTQIVNSLSILIPQIIAIIPQLINSLVNALPQIVSALVNSLPNLIGNLTGAIISYAPQIAVALIKGAVMAFGSLCAAIPALVANVAQSIWANLKGLWSAVQGWITTGEWNFEPVTIDFETGETTDVTETGNELTNEDYGTATIEFDSDTTGFDEGATEVKEETNEIDGTESIAEIQADTALAKENLEAIKEVEEEMPKDFEHTITIKSDGVKETVTTLGNFVTTYSQLKQKTAKGIKVTVTANTKSATKAINKISKSSKKMTIKVTANIASATKSIAKIANKKIKDKSFNVKIKGYDSVMTKLNNINNKKLKDKSFTVTQHNKKTGANIKDGSGRIGIREIPYDGYMAELHKGETVLTAAETNQYQKMMDAQNQYKQASEQLAKANIEAQSTNYSFGDITLEVSSLKDAATIEDIVKVFKQAKAFA